MPCTEPRNRTVADDLLVCGPVFGNILRSVVWEKLDQIDGDTEYVDSDFTRSSRCSLANADHPADIMAGQHE